MGIRKEWHGCGISVNRHLWHACGMPKDDHHFRLRMSQDLRQRIYAASLSNDRSMTQEIVARLEESFLFGKPAVADPTDGELLNVLNAIEHIKVNVIRLRNEDARRRPKEPSPRKQKGRP